MVLPRIHQVVAEVAILAVLGLLVERLTRSQLRDIEQAVIETRRQLIKSGEYRVIPDDHMTTVQLQIIRAEVRKLYIANLPGTESTTQMDWFRWHF